MITQASLRLGPVVLETLLKHYFDRFTKKDRSNSTNLREEELLYDEAFNIVKDFLQESTYYSVEDVQAFANVRTPSPPWVHVVRLLVPMSCCNDAATILVKVLGGEEAAKRIVGGVKWWQVRGVNGVDGQWITAKKDWKDAKRRAKMHGHQSNGKESLDPKDEGTTPPVYEQEMDEMRCILYIHGGGYFFGSVDQERYSIQRHARKINGRVFAINYRLAPQYPFPCALQDALASYLYLIRPPPGAAHRPVKPAHMIIMGDSAGGGLTLSLLQVLRDSGLPMPAGGVLISPWCDLTHSFPSIHTNTATDIIPNTGLSLQKPSTLWPPPSDAFSKDIHASLRSRILTALHMDEASPAIDVDAKIPLDVGATTQAPDLNTQTIALTLDDGERLEIREQVHLYTQNSLMKHPLVSPGLSYLGGLPPLMFIASDREVLRDEIIYTAHKASNPEKYPVHYDVRALYAPLDGIETQYERTQVHLQVYDDAAHILPVLFSFTTPAKYCYRAIATFCKHATGMMPAVYSPIMDSFPPIQPFPRMHSSPEVPTSPLFSDKEESSTPVRSGTLPPPRTSKLSVPAEKPPLPWRIPLSRSFSSNVSRSAKSKSSLLLIRSSSREDTGTATPALPPLPHMTTGTSASSSDVGGLDPRLTFSPPPDLGGKRTAGDGIVYSETLDFPSWKHTMIRERVSTQGVVRPLEPEPDLDCFTVPEEKVGSLNELSIRRYLTGRAKFDEKFKGAIKTVEKHRRLNIDRSKKDTNRNLTHLQATLNQHEDAKSRWKGIREGLLESSGSWNWAWALDADERPPPSSIASRRDTHEARQLARIADLSVLTEEEKGFSANNLWSIMVDFLTVKPEKKDGKTEEAALSPRSIPMRKSTSRFSRIFNKVTMYNFGTHIIPRQTAARWVNCNLKL